MPPAAPRPPAANLGGLFLPETYVTRPRDGHTGFLAAAHGTSPSFPQVYVWVLVHEEGGVPAARSVSAWGYVGKGFDDVTFRHKRAAPFSAPPQGANILQHHPVVRSRVTYRKHETLTPW